MTARAHCRRRDCADMPMSKACWFRPPRNRPTRGKRRWLAHCSTALTPRSSSPNVATIHLRLGRAIGGCSSVEPGERIARLSVTWRVGVDSGGTFTDVCLFDDSSGRVEVWKVSSTPDDPSRGIAQGVAEGAERVGAAPGDIGYFGHGTTVATNALIQHRGVRTGLITSHGFRDLLEIGRQKRPDLYDLQADKPPVLVERRLRHEVPERLRYDGRVETPLDEAAVRTAVRVLRDAGVVAVAICFLYSFLDPAHEQAACRIVAEEFPEAFVCASNEVAPEFREYERLSTTVVNAYLGPIMAFYIRGVADRLTVLGVNATPYL